MEYLLVFAIMSIVVGIISISWVNGIDYMKENHPDYKGEDFLNWDRKNDGWDDNKSHTEGKL